MEYGGDVIAKGAPDVRAGANRNVSCLVGASSLGGHSCGDRHPDEHRDRIPGSRPAVSRRRSACPQQRGRRFHFRDHRRGLRSAARFCRHRGLGEIQRGPNLSRKRIRRRRGVVLLLGGAEPEAAKLRENLIHYLKLVIDSDWPAMATDNEDSKTTDALGSLYRAAMALNRSGTRSVADMSEVFTQIDNLTLARRVRLHLSTGLVPEIIWITLFAGAGLTVCFALFFGSPNGLAHLAMTGILSIVLAAGLVVIIALDHPFSGPVHISPESLEHVLAIAEHG